MRLEFRRFVGSADWGFVQKMLPVFRVEDTTGLMAIDMDTNTTVGFCIMDNFTNNSVQAHFFIAKTMVLKHGFLEACFDIMFNACGKKLIYGQVPSDNEKALKLNAHMGFTEKCRLTDAYADGVDYVILELKKENCKYLPKEEAA